MDKLGRRNLHAGGLFLGTRNYRGEFRQAGGVARS
jgi:hypothetical protein